tara:strand:+ start:143 stop:667 length:525 start_codon:yes stop_codon:yes gene_type:complete
MERIHYIIGIIIFLIFTVASVADDWIPLKEEIVAVTLLGEARGEGEAGLYAVACVIQKRAQERDLLPAEVCQQYRTVKGRKVWQFSTWADKKYVGTMEKLIKADTKEAKYAKYLAKELTKRDPRKFHQKFTGHANHFYSHKIMRKPPYWAKGFKPTKVIGNHTFYKLPWASNNK